MKRRNFLQILGGIAGVALGVKGLAKDVEIFETVFHESSPDEIGSFETDTLTAESLSRIVAEMKKRGMRPYKGHYYMFVHEKEYDRAIQIVESWNIPLKVYKNIPMPPNVRIPLR